MLAYTIGSTICIPLIGEGQQRKFLIGTTNFSRFTYGRGKRSPLCLKALDATQHQ
jgi:hypothetical protein